MEIAPDHFEQILDSLHDGVYLADTDRRITYWSKGAERLTGYAAGEVLGSHCADGILIHVNDRGESLCGGGCPLAGATADGKPCEAEIYFRHKDGHRVPSRTRVAPIRDAAGSVVGSVETFSDNSWRAEATRRIEQLRDLALIDELTRLPNRRHIEIAATGRLEELKRYGWPFGAVFIDIDHFKRVNDSHGHDAGDAVLKTVARTLLENSRGFDILGRWGGEEFLGLVQNVDEDHLGAVSERLRALVAASSARYDDAEIRVTVSIGATLARTDDTPEGLVKRADSLMYESKRAGCDRVTLAS